MMGGSKIYCNPTGHVQLVEVGILREEYSDI
jgi:hypothetical protein